MRKKNQPIYDQSASKQCLPSNHEERNKFKKEVIGFR